MPVVHPMMLQRAHWLVVSIDSYTRRFQFDSFFYPFLCLWQTNESNEEKNTVESESRAVCDQESTSLSFDIRREHIIYSAWWFYSNLNICRLVCRMAHGIQSVNICKCKRHSARFFLLHTQSEKYFTHSLCSRAFSSSIRVHSFFCRSLRRRQINLISFNFFSSVISLFVLGNLSPLSFSQSTLTSICIRSTHFNFIVNKMRNGVLVLTVDARRPPTTTMTAISEILILVSRFVVRL